MSDLITLRKKKSSKFYSVDLRIIENSELSWAAKGVWTYLISRPDGWAVNRSDLLGKSKDGDTALRAILKELTEAGLLKIERVKVKGKFGPTVWIVSEDYDLSDVENPHVEKPCVENPHVVNPQAEKPHVENPHDLEGTSITNYLLTNYQDTKDQINTPCIPPSGEVPETRKKSASSRSKKKRVFSEEGIPLPKHDPDGFLRYVRAHPKQTHLASAANEWDERKPTPEMVETWVSNVSIRAVEDKDWVKENGAFVPNPAAYLKECHWLKKYTKVSVSSGSQGVTVSYQQKSPGQSQSDEEYRANVEASKRRWEAKQAAQQNGQNLSEYDGVTLDAVAI